MLCYKVPKPGPRLGATQPNLCQTYPGTAGTLDFCVLDVVLMRPGERRRKILGWFIWESACIAG